MLAAPEVIEEAETRFAQIFGRHYTGMLETTYTDDADVVLVTLGSVAGLAESVLDQLREKGIRAGLVRIRYMRPFPKDELAHVLSRAHAIGVLEKDISFGGEGTVFTNVNSALLQAGVSVPTCNFIGGLGGDDISVANLCDIYKSLARMATQQSAGEPVRFIGIDNVGGHE